MALLKKFRCLGIDVYDQKSVVMCINTLAITDNQKTEMLRQYLTELDKPLSVDAGNAAGFPV